MSSRLRREAYDIPPNASTAAHNDPYKVWVPLTQAESDRSRHQRVTDNTQSADQNTSARRHGEKHHSSSRGYRPEGYAASLTAASSHHNKSIPSTSRVSQSTSRPPASYNPVAPPPAPTSSLQSSVPHAQTQSHPQQKLPAELSDPRIHAHKRTAAAPSPRSSYERVSGTEDGAKASRQMRSRSGQTAAVPSAAPAPELWIPPTQGPPATSKRHRDREQDREQDREKGREKDRHHEKPRDRPDRHMGTEVDSKRRERERIREKEKYQERRERDRDSPSQREHRSVSKPTSSSRDLPDHRIEEPESSDSSRRNPAATSSGHRRHRTEEGTSSTVNVG